MHKIKREIKIILWNLSKHEQTQSPHYEATKNYKVNYIEKEKKNEQLIIISKLPSALKANIIHFTTASSSFVDFTL